MSEGWEAVKPTRVVLRRTERTDDAHRALDHLRHQRLAEGNGRALEDAAAVAARRVFLARAHALERLVHRRGHAATHAYHHAE